jgi:hypothetical protein
MGGLWRKGAGNARGKGILRADGEKHGILGLTHWRRGQVFHVTKHSLNCREAFMLFAETPFRQTLGKATKMKRIVTILSAVGLMFAVSGAAISTADAKASMFVTKKTRKTAIPASFTKNGYTFKCAKWGDCGNYNIAF